MNNQTMTGRVCIVTGASNGIGRETALGLARTGATVIAVARNVERGNAAVSEIRTRSGNDAIHLAIADLSSQAAIRDLARDLRNQYPRIHVLVNNAGAINNQRTVTVDGIETTWAVNHLAYFLLTDLLLPTLRQSAPARIVNVSSEAHTGGSINFDDPQLEHGYSAWRAYNQSKLANIMFTYELARRVPAGEVTANALHPGTVATGFGKNNSGLLNLGLQLASPFMTKPDKGAETSIYLASSPEVEGVTGKYFEKCKEVRSAAQSYDEEAAKRLWQISAEMTGLSE